MLYKNRNALYSSRLKNLMTCNISAEQELHNIFSFVSIILEFFFCCIFFFFQAEDGIRDVERSRGLGDVYKRQDY